MIAKSKKEKETLREGGRRLASVLAALSREVVPGLSTATLEEHTLTEMEKVGGKPAFLNYTPHGAPRPYPAALCTSVNEEVVHGIPNEEPRILREGDIVTLDAGLIYKGLVTDMALTVTVGKVEVATARLIDAARECLAVALKTARAGSTTGDIGAMVAATASRYGFTTPTELGGHGVGKSVHEDPFIPNYGKPGEGTKLEEGMVLAIEPIVIAGDNAVRVEDDGYTYVTVDNSISAQFEHTVIVTSDEPEILTVV